MKKNNKLDKDFENLHHILKMGRYKLKSPRFEENIMFKIGNKKNYVLEVKQSIRQSFIYFVVGFALGMALILNLLFTNYFEAGTLAHILCVFSLFVLAVLGLLLYDNYSKLLRSYSTENKP